MLCGCCTMLMPTASTWSCKYEGHSSTAAQQTDKQAFSWWFQKGSVGIRQLPALDPASKQVTAGSQTGDEIDLTRAMKDVGKLHHAHPHCQHLVLRGVTSDRQTCI
jgi:hypothetical protein